MRYIWLKVVKKEYDNGRILQGKRDVGTKGNNFFDFGFEFFYFCANRSPGSVMITTISVIRRGKYTLHQLIGLFIKITHPLLYFFLRLFRIYSEKRILLRTLASEDK